MMLNITKDVSKMFDEKRYDDALNLFDEKIHDNILHPYLCVLKGRLIQMSNGSKYGLEDAVKMFKKAIELDEEYIDAYTELGFYYFAVGNDNQMSLKYFKKAYSLCNKKMKETLNGLTKLIDDIEN